MRKKNGLFSIGFIRSFKDGQDGVTLIEAAIGLLVLGLIATPLIQAFKNDIIRETTLGTKGSLGNIENAINQYHANGNFSYPCPAGVHFPEGHAQYGEAADCSVFANIPVCTNPTWDTTAGICRTPGAASNAVVYGAVPFAALNMQQEEVLDFWGNKILYAVTFEQTNFLSFKTNPGMIQIMARDGLDDPAFDGTPNVIPAMEVDFVVFSTGSTARGGYTKDGTPVANCNDPLAMGYDNENCDLDNVFFVTENPSFKRGSGAFSGGTDFGVDFFDDIIRYQESVPEMIWFPHPDNDVYTNNGANPEEAFVISSSTRIGIGTSIPDDTLHVRGNVLVDNWVKTDSLCDENGNNCTDPELISGDRDETKCDPGDTMHGDQPAYRLGQNRLDCLGVFDSTGTNVTPNNAVALRVDTTVVRGSSTGTNGRCPAGSIVSGIDATGEAICTAL